MSFAITVGQLLGCGVLAVEPMTGGQLSLIHKCTLSDGTWVVAKQGPMASREGAMLEAIAATGAPAPRVLGCDDDLLLLEWIDGEAGPGSAWKDLARILSMLHAHRGHSCGWNEDYAFGDLPIDNGPCEDWPSFWANRRLLCGLSEIPLELARRIERLAERLGDRLPGDPPLSLLHGDLWGGNILASEAVISALIDPACYFGDREVDIAMLTLFDRPPAGFFEILQLDQGWRERQAIYRLWPLLVHARLFGAQYHGSIAATLESLGI